MMHTMHTPTGCPTRSDQPQAHQGLGFDAPCSVLTRPSSSCLRAASSDMAYTALTPRDAISCVTSFASPSSPLNASCSGAASRV
jgi:hypothetical protein